VTILAVLTLLLVSSPPAFAAATRLVSPTGTDTGDCTVNPCKTIGYAIGQSVSGDIISAAAGTYAEHVVVDRSLTLRGAGSASTILDGSNSGTVITVGSVSTSLTVTIAGLTVKNGLAETGGGITSVPGSGHSNVVNVRNSAVANNQAVGGVPGAAGTGGGAYNAAGSTMKFSLSSVSANSAIGAMGAPPPAQPHGGIGLGGGIYNAGSLTIMTSTVSGNSAVGGASTNGNVGGNSRGGGIYNSGSLSVLRSVLSRNSAAGGRGGTTSAVGATGGAALGGGLYVDMLSVSTTLANATLSKNSATGGPRWRGLLRSGW